MNSLEGFWVSGVVIGVVILGEPFIGKARVKRSFYCEENICTGNIFDILN